MIAIAGMIVKYFMCASPELEGVREKDIKKESVLHKVEALDADDNEAIQLQESNVLYEFDWRLHRHCFPKSLLRRDA